MSAYVAPSTLFIRTRTGLNRFIERFDPEDIDAKLKQLRADVEPEVEINVTTEVWSSGDLTAGQVTLLKRAVAYRTAAAYLISPGTEKLTGTQEPLLMGEADEILDFADRLAEMATALETKLSTGAGVPPVAEGEVFALPSVSASGPSVTATDWSPAEKLRQLDERENVRAGVA